MALGEALTNLMWARATSLADIKASVNWMYAAKLGSEGADMYDAAVALKCEFATFRNRLTLASQSADARFQCPHDHAMWPALGWDWHVS